MTRILLAALCLTSTAVPGTCQDSDLPERETDASTTADGADQAPPAAGSTELPLEQALDAAHENHLTEAEKQQGWKLLFDGKKIEGWRRYGLGTTNGLEFTRIDRHPTNGKFVPIRVHSWF